MHGSCSENCFANDRCITIDTLLLSLYSDCHLIVSGDALPTAHCNTTGTVNRHYTTAALVLQCNCTATTLPLHCHYTATTPPLHRHYTATTLPLHYHYTATTLSHTATAPPLYTSTSPPLRCYCATTTIPLHYHYAATALPLH